MDTQKVQAELALLLGDEHRDFSRNPISNGEGHDLMVQLFDLVADKRIPDHEAAHFMMLYEHVKRHVLLS